jgi:hypothetical protein
MSSRAGRPSLERGRDGREEGPIMSRTVSLVSAFALLATLTATAAAEPATPPPDRAHFGVSYLSLAEDGAETRTAAGLDLNVAWSPAIKIAGAKPGLAFWDSLFLRFAMGKLLSTPIADESALAIDFAAGYQLLAGWRTETWAAMGGIGFDYGMALAGDPSLGGFSFPLVGHAELALGGSRRLAGTATAGFIGARKQLGADAMVRLVERWGLGVNFTYVSGSEDMGTAPALETSGFTTSLTVRIDRL